MTGVQTCALPIYNHSFFVSQSRYEGNILFASHDHEFIQTVSNRIIELTPNGIIDKLMDYDDYITDENIKAQKQKMYGY